MKHNNILNDVTPLGGGGIKDFVTTVPITKKPDNWGSGSKRLSKTA